MLKFLRNDFEKETASDWTFMIGMPNELRATMRYPVVIVFETVVARTHSAASQQFKD